MASYVVLLAPRAERDHRKLPREIRPRINETLLNLEINPRPEGTHKLRAAVNRWRIQVGDYRIIYTIDDAVRQIMILRIAHRREVYR